MGRLLASLTARLVLTVVALVVLVAVLIGGAATVALHSRLTNQLDNQLSQAAHFGAGGGGGIGGPGGGPDGDQPRLRAGSLSAYVDAGVEDRGQVSGYRPGSGTALSAAALNRLADIPTDAHIHSLDVPGQGHFRVVAIQLSNGTAVLGLPTRDVDSAVNSLLIWEATLIVLGGLLAAGGGLVLVRRQLRPLNQVAATAHAVSELPLAEGDVDLSARVPAELTDERTEVGQVGAALNTLLAHVETSLEARHRSEQQVRQFVADASHELRTPLATIAGYTELARRRPDDPETVATAVAKVEEESARMTALVEDLLLLARLDAGRPLEREPVDLTRLLIEAVDDARVLAPEHRWRLELPDLSEPSDDGDDEPAQVVGDAQRLHQVVTNLLTNARKYTPAGTTVTVTALGDGFDVHDDGPGFPPDFVDKAFERFARVDPARQRVGGAGLGLALVDAIVRSHGGTVALDSAPSSTTISVRLPSPTYPRLSDNLAESALPQLR